MGMVLRLGAEALIGQAAVGKLEGVMIGTSEFDVKALWIGMTGTSSLPYPPTSIHRSDNDRIELTTGPGLEPILSSEIDGGAILLSKKTRVMGTDGWVSGLEGVEIDRLAYSVVRFLFDMGYPTPRIVAVDRWFVHDVREREVNLKLTAADLSTYPTFLTFL